MSLAASRQCERCDGELDQELLRAGPLKKICLECLSDEERDASDVVRTTLQSLHDFQAGAPHIDDVTAMAIRWRGSVS
jgi:RNA polymerase-binding transcription factor DksA